VPRSASPACAWSPTTSTGPPATDPRCAVPSAHCCSRWSDALPRSTDLAGDGVATLRSRS
jgi:hypothetical protein